MSILVGDIGGTHCRLATATREGKRVNLSQVTRFQNAEHDSLQDMLRAYFQQAPRSETACLAVAGPTDGRTVRFTNLDWHIDANELAAALGLTRLQLINDFTAVGWGLNVVQPEHLHTLQPGQPNAQANLAAVGAGTGLGVSIAVPQHDGHMPFATEGGHIGFAPTDAEQDRLLAYLRLEYGRVSMERLVSGPGIEMLYRFACQELGHPTAKLAANAISQAALNGSNSAAQHAMRLFLTLYGQVAGDIALVSRAQGGLYLAGGIAAQILPLFSAPHFLRGFSNKGRFSEWMHQVPVHVVLDADIGLKGAAAAC